MYRKALVCFMEEKAKEISRRTGLHEELYFDEEDKKDIIQWEPALAQKVWEWIGDALRRGDYNAAVLCPFCQAYLCENCPYAKNHGRCSSDESDFKKIVTALRVPPQNIFTTEEWIAMYLDCGKRAGLDGMEVMFYGVR